MSTTIDGIAPAGQIGESTAARRSLGVASSAVLLTLGVVAGAAVAVTLAPATFASAIDNAQQGVSVLGATIAVLAMRRAAPAGQRWLTGALGLGLALAGTGMVIWGLAPDGPSSAAGPAGILFVLALAIVGGALFRAFTLNLDRNRTAQVVLDGLVVIAATACLLIPVWYGPVTTSDAPAMPIAVALAVVIVAVPMAGYLALIDRRFQPGVWGPYAALHGLLVGGLSWLAWLVLLARGQAAAVTPIDWGFSLAVILLAWGGVTWDRPPRPSRLFVRSAGFIVDVFPLTAVALCVVLMILADRHPMEPFVEVGTAAVVAFGLVRQLSLVRRERDSRERERAAADRLAREIRHRALVLGSLATFESGATPEDTAARICALALGVGDLAQAAILVFEPDGSATLLAEAGPVATADVAGTIQPPEVSEPLRERLAGGAWAEPVAGRTDPHARALLAAGMEWVVNAPVTFGGRLLGRLSLASPGDAARDLQAERLTTAREFGLLVGAILGGPLDERASLRATREALIQVIDGWAFRTVFQPIVDLRTGTVVGYEALTRFEDGTRPDLRFDEAEAVGLGIALERATLESAVRSSVRLPHDTYLSLNASPALASDLTAILALVARIPCPVVLEITEHAAVASYEELRASLDQIRRHVRIAVDDVGAGYSGLRHILEIAPDLLKLDMALVRDVDADAAKRALIGSIVSFAREAGSKVVAEGIETIGEARALRRLGVHLGQGFLFGRPDRIDQIAVDGWLDEAHVLPVPAGVTASWSKITAPGAGRVRRRGYRFPVPAPPPPPVGPEASA